jgi:hypothetical protein
MTKKFYDFSTQGCVDLSRRGLQKIVETLLVPFLRVLQSEISKSGKRRFLKISGFWQCVFGLSKFLFVLNYS